MSDVACVCCAPLVAEVRARGLDAGTLVAGLPVSLAQLENPRRRIAWEPFRAFARRASELLGGPRELEEVAARSAHQAVPQILRALLPRLGSPRRIYLVGARWWGPWVFRGTRASCEELADGRLREVIEILPGYGECPELFEGLRGILRAMPRLFGQPDAVVDLAQDGRRAEYLIATAPARRRRPRRTRRGWQGALRAGNGGAGGSSLPAGLEDLEELGFRQEQLRDALRRAHVAAALLAERTRRLDTVHRLGAQLVWHGDTRTRVEGIVRLLQGLLAVRGIRLFTADGDRPVRLAEWGNAVGPPSATRPLQVEGRSVGRLDLWVGGSGRLGVEDEELLGELTPWLTLVLDAARADHEIRELREQLEHDLSQWHRAERRLQQLLGDEASRERSVDLAERLRDWTPRLARLLGRGAALEVHCDEALEPARVDVDALERLLVELVTDLRDARSRRVRIEARAGHGAAAGAEPAERAIELELCGEGADTTARTRARLLEPLAFAAVGPAPARLDVAPGDEGAACLRLCIPLRVAERAGPGETVLLVEGEPTLREEARRVLEGEGYRVLEAASLAEAVRVCDAGVEPVELLMADWAEPSLDLDAARRAMRRHPALRGVMLLRLRRP